MKKKIIITGGLGYIGSELCKIYSGVSWKHKIVVLDNGSIVGEGTHEELLNNNKFYKKMWEIDISLSQLKNKTPEINN